MDSIYVIRDSAGKITGTRRFASPGCTMEKSNLDDAEVKDFLNKSTKPSQSFGSFHEFAEVYAKNGAAAAEQYLKSKL